MDIFLFIRKLNFSVLNILPIHMIIVEYDLIHLRCKQYMYVCSLFKLLVLLTQEIELVRVILNAILHIDSLTYQIEKYLPQI